MCRCAFTRKIFSINLLLSQPSESEQDSDTEVAVELTKRFKSKVINHNNVQYTQQ